MTRPDETAERITERPAPSRRARLQALLFAGAALGTTLLTLGAAAEPKLPPFRGD
jgi:hypothetical protein